DFLQLRPSGSFRMVAQRPWIYSRHRICQASRALLLTTVGLLIAAAPAAAGDSGSRALRSAASSARVGAFRQAQIGSPAGRPHSNRLDERHGPLDIEYHLRLAHPTTH